MEYERFALEKWYENKNTDKDISESGMNHFNIILHSEILNNIDWNDFAYYGETAGRSELRDLIASIYTCDKKNILITNGASEAVFMALEALLDKNDEIICVLPYYNSIHSLLKKKSIRVLECNIEIDNFNNYFNNLLNLISENTKLILLSSINNPTGIKLTHNQYYKLIDIAISRGFYIIFDDVFVEIADFDSNYLFDYSKLEKVIHINSLSKSYGFPGLRLGWIITDTFTITRLVAIKSYISENASLISQACAINILKNRGIFLHRNKKIFETNMQILKKWVSRLDNVRIIEPYEGFGGCCCLIKYDFPIDSYSFCENIYIISGILLVPGVFFGYEYSFRIGYGVDSNYFKNILDELMRYIIIL